MPKENFYILLELSPTENDASRIDAAIKKKQHEWSKLRPHPTKARKAQYYLGLISEIKNVMSDPALRVAEAKAAQALLDRAEKEKFEKLDEYIEMYSLRGEVFEKELRKLSLEFSDLSEAEIRRRIKVPIVKDAPGYKKLPQLDKTTAKVISNALEIVGKSSLYDFMGLETSANLNSLQKATRKKDLEIKNVALKDAVITASGVLVGQCQTVFKTQVMRDAYDATLAIERLSELDKTIEMMGVSGHIHLKAYQHLVKKAAGVGLGEDEARRYILEYCKKNHCLVDVAPVKSARQAPVKPVSQAKINKPPPQPGPQWVWGVGLLLAFLVLVVWLVSPYDLERQQVAELDAEKVSSSSSKELAAVNQNEKVVAQASVEQATPPKSGKEIYDSVCIVCHASGITGAPKFGDKADWASRITKGEATLIQNAINGINGINGVMPPRGGSISLSDNEMKLAVRYMLEAVGAYAEKVSSLENGKKHYQHICPACHTIGGGRLVGPDLKGVMSRRELSWLVRWIQEPDKMLAEGDPVATQLLREYNIPMPNMGVSESEARDILAYIEAESFGN
jgi:cytochrome c5